MKTLFLTILLAFIAFASFADSITLGNLTVGSTIIAPGKIGNPASGNLTVAFAVAYNGGRPTANYSVTIGNGLPITGSVSLNQSPITISLPGTYRFTDKSTLVTITIAAVGANFADDVATYTVEPTNPLPVELTKFTGTAGKGVTTLSWSTATESNFKYFAVQKSVNSVDFVTVGTVNTLGSHSNYRYETPSGDIAYFRLKIVDTDSSFKYSPVISVTSQRTLFTTELYDMKGRKLPANAPKQGFMVIVETNTTNGQRTMRKVFYQ